MGRPEPSSPTSTDRRRGKIHLFGNGTGKALPDRQPKDSTIYGAGQAGFEGGPVRLVGAGTMARNRLSYALVLRGNVRSPR